MSTDKDMEDRLAALEVHVTHQDSIIDDLNDMTAKQWAIIDDLQRRVGDLKSRLEEVEDSAGNAPSREPPPPHH